VPQQKAIIHKMVAWVTEFRNSKEVPNVKNLTVYPTGQHIELYSLMFSTRRLYLAIVIFSIFNVDAISHTSHSWLKASSGQTPKLFMEECVLYIYL